MEPVLWRMEGAVGVLTLNRPDRLNAWTPAMGVRYHELLERAAADPEVRAIVITGAGRGFCAGADMEVLDAIAADAPPIQDQRPHSVLRDIPKPVIAAVNGAAAGMGLVVAGMCDLRFAADDAKLTTAFARRGLVAEYGLAWVLNDLLGSARALDLLLSARTLLAPEALALGLVDRVHPRDEVLSAAIAYATELAERSSPWSMAQVKFQVHAAQTGGLAEAEALAEALMEESFTRPDLPEGVASYLERRPPRFPPLGLAEVGAVVRGRVADGTIPGALVLVAQGGEVVHSELVGSLDLAPDLSFWLASLTKPVIAAAVLMLAQDGRLALDDEVADHLPELGAPRAVRTWNAPPPMGLPGAPAPADLPGFRLDPAERALTLRDLLTHTAGLQMLMAYNPDFPWPSGDETLAQYVPKLAGVPLDFQPGTCWGYSNAGGFDVLGRVIEVASGQRLGAFLLERIFTPLGMTSARFGGIPGMPGTAFESGGAGLWMSATDYRRFAELLLRGGDDLLSAESVREMTTNQVGALMESVNGRPPAPGGAGLGFGLSVVTVEDAAATGLAVPDGSFGWDGITTRRFWASPREQRFLFMYIPDQAVQAEVEAAVAAALG
ncbi:MAG TPA: serine hydrolase [Baekduia sp.]|nr:serine hydrolase [Baekduia sp.]